MVFELDPLSDARWTRLLDWHPAASAFHTPEWFQALRRTYGYKVRVFTTAAPGEQLANGLAVCTVRSWLTGCRSVSLPFSDHCEPLAGGDEERGCLISALERDLHVTGAKYFEIRSLTGNIGSAQEVSQYCLHQLDLRPPPEDLFRAMHRDCIQRKVRRAEREQLRYESGRSESLLRWFYALTVLTRQRQGAPPQPLAWFRNLLDIMGDRLNIRLVSKSGYPVAGILTLQHKRTLVYKYGCSDKSFSRLGGTPYLFWQAIQEAKADGLETFDLGRSDWENEGLIRFKDRLGAERKHLSYWRYPVVPGARTRGTRLLGISRRVLPCLPAPCLTTMGKLLYRHIG